ncbi:MAG TPA: delta-60 repeat domain-containing protein [Chthoniobacterales bacterium]|nr:delta-60 repeat domain-containing protein [Chthoniobacterales bacterium]
MSFAVILASGAGAVHGQSALDGFDPNASGAVNVVVVQPDGKILLGGDFTTLSPSGGAAVTRNRIARLNPDGTLDTAFNPNANAAVHSIAVQADGKILVGGQFTGTNSIGGQTRNYIARLDATTGAADSFDPNANGTVRSIAVQADGNVIAGGAFFTIGGQARYNIARLDATTGLADSFNPNADLEVFSIALQADGKILVGGRFRNIGGQPRYNIARLDPVTGHADSFDPNTGYCCGSGMEAVYAIAVQADGKVLIGGAFESIGGLSRRNIGRVDGATGQPDSFNANANDDIITIAVQADGKILVGGNFTSIGGEARNHIARLNPVSGAADSFAPHTSSGGVLSIAVQADGKILAGGDFTAVAPNKGALVTRNRIARLEADGRLDQTLNLNAVGSEVYATAVQADGKILIGGNFTSVLGVPRNHIARLNRDGTLDAAFDPNADSIVYAIATQADGKILVGGAFTGIGGLMRNHIACLDPLTGLPDSFNPNANDDVLCIAVQLGDRKIFAGGQFTTIGGQMRNRIAGLYPVTGVADQFNPDSNGTVRSIILAEQTDYGFASVMLGGAFTNIGGQERNHIAVLLTAGGGALLTGFNPNVQGQDVYAIVPHGNGLLVGGLFTGIGGQPRNNIARLAGSGGTPDSFDPNANDGVSSIVLQADGKILVGGAFNGANSIGGQARNRVARLDPDTGQADSFDPNANDTVYSLALQADGKVLAGGLFTSIGGEPRTAFARLSNDTAARQELIVTQTTVTWTLAGSSPQFTTVFFSYSTDNLNYTPLGQGFRYPKTSGANWLWFNPNFGPFPAEQNIYIQARGGYFNSSECVTESVQNAFLLPGARPLNLSTRMRVGTGDHVGIGGFIIKPDDFLVFDNKHVLIRVVGASFDQLADPVLELHSPDPYPTVINDNWRDDPLQAEAILATGLAPPRDLDSAIDASLHPGSYTVVVRGNNNSSGVGVIEIYDLDPPVPTKLANISTRALVGTGDNILIAGFILGGSGANDQIVVRGLGPSLTAFNVPDALPNPTLELRDGNGALLIANNDWPDDPDQAAALIAAGLAPASEFESGLAATLSPGLYTALLRGLNNGTGIGLVEVYSLGPP